jgi:hypothetical protein
MRTLLPLTLAFALAPAARAQDDARTIIEKAIQAHGGAAALDKYVAGRSKAKGKIVFRNTEYPYTAQTVFHLPDRIKVASEITAPGLRRNTVQILNGGKTAMFADGLAQHLAPAQADEMKVALYVQNVTRLTPLLKDGRFKLAAAGEKAIDGRPTTGVRVSSDGQKDVRLYFDRGTGLLAAVERPGFDAQGKPTDQLEVYSDYRETGGLKHPGKTVILQSGKSYIESETVEFQPLEKVDPKEFTANPS